MRGFVKYLMLLLAGILAASCIFDADRPVLSADEPHGIMFTVSLDNHTTRASWDEEYEKEDGLPFDIRIQPDGLSVVVLAEDGTRLGNIQDLGYWPTNEKHTEFQFIGQLPDEFVSHFNANNGESQYRFMVLANSDTNLKGEEYVTFRQSQLDPSSQDSSIPMWGVKQVDLTALLTSSTHDIGDISLLRAAAKIEVKLSDHLKNTAITSATLKYYNQTGYVLPNGWSQVTDTRLLDQENCIRLYRHAAVNLPFVKDETTGDYYVYVTEYDNQNYSGERNKISLGFNINGEEKYFEDAISFCNYSDGKPVENSEYNIVRNHIYEFEIMHIAGDNIVLEYTVADWDSERWDTDGDGVLDSDYEEHDLAYPTYHNPVVPAEYLTLAPGVIDGYNINIEPQMSYNANDLEAGAFECFFQITAPVDVVWKPGISGTLENYKVRVYNHTTGPENGTLLYDSTDKNVELGACRTDSWYRIVVFPLSNEGADQNQIEFTISYHQSWTDQYIHLYINGEYDNIRWPQSGDNPKIIKIRHVTQ